MIESMKYLNLVNLTKWNFLGISFRLEWASIGLELGVLLGLEQMGWAGSWHNITFRGAFLSFSYQLWNIPTNSNRNGTQLGNYVLHSYIILIVIYWLTVLKDIIRIFLATFALEA